MSRNKCINGLANAALPLFEAGQDRIGFVDVGSGGPLKNPWYALPHDRVDRLEFDPEISNEEMPLCVSNQTKESDFFIARDPRASSLHRSLESFFDRFGMESLLAEREIRVKCKTLDEIVSSQKFIVDALDVNTEGHDWQVLQGSENLLRSGSVKIAKIEFELASVWDGQGYFSDIDQLMRRHGFELCFWENDVVRQKEAQSFLLDPGEPVWGKAWYAPSLIEWKSRKDQVSPAEWKEQCHTAAAIFVICGFLGRAFEVLKLVLPEEGGATDTLRRSLATLERQFRLDSAKQHILEACRWFKRALPF